VLENLADSQADITHLITNLDTLFGTLAGRASEIALVNQRFSLVTRALEDDRKNLEGTIENLAFLSDQGTKLVTESGQTLGVSFGRLKTVIDAVLRHQDQLVEGMKWSNVIAEALGATDREGKGLYAYSGRQAPPNTPGAEYNYRIDQRDVIACRRIDVVAKTITTILPGTTVEGFLPTLTSFTPDVYDDDLEYLFLKLTPLCSRIKTHDPGVVTPKQTAVIHRLEHQIGRKKLMQLLAMWLLGGSPGGVTP
jgi:hypothetical protein